MTGETGSCKCLIVAKVIANVLSLESCPTTCLLLFVGETTDRYMAPEVFKHRKYDKKVDVFSFAMILYEVIVHSAQSE